MKHGGKREGAGRPKSKYKSKNVTFRIREEWEMEFKNKVREIIKQLKEK